MKKCKVGIVGLGKVAHLHAGVHVLVEKPLASTLQDCDYIFQQTNISDYLQI